MSLLAEHSPCERIVIARLVYIDVQGPAFLHRATGNRAVHRYVAKLDIELATPRYIA